MRRQQEKTLQTRKELKASAYKLFMERPFDTVSIVDIVTDARYSVGAFYKHFKAKVDVLTELISDALSAYTMDTIGQTLASRSMDEAVDCLVRRSTDCGSLPILSKCINTSNFYLINQDEKATNAFHEMLRTILRRKYPNCDEQRLHNYASVWHVILNAHAIKQYANHAVLYYDDETLKKSLLCIANLCS